jgi:diguanylate cyclase (GGDEF)-like protein
LLGAGWLLLDGNAAVTALGIGSSICLSALTALLVSLTHASSPAPSADRPGRPASAATRLPPGVADETLLERLTVHEMTRARRYERPLTLLLVGVEGWSTICAERGRRSAHELLGTLAIRIRRLLRDVDAIGLHGDGRLAILLPETPLDGALVVAGRIERMATDDVGLKVRLGASLFPEDAVTVEGLIREADAALDLARLEQVSVAERVRLA